jgi:hypothetical protein
LNEGGKRRQKEKVQMSETAIICPKCGDEIESDDQSLDALTAASAEHETACPGPEYRGALKACPFCGSPDIDPEGWSSGGCQCPDAAAHEVMGQQCNVRRGPACDDCGALAETVERWNTRVAISTLLLSGVAEG